MWCHKILLGIIMMKNKRELNETRPSARARSIFFTPFRLFVVCRRFSSTCKSIINDDLLVGHTEYFFAERRLRTKERGISIWWRCVTDWLWWGSVVYHACRHRCSTFSFDSFVRNAFLLSNTDSSSKSQQLGPIIIVEETLGKCNLLEISL